MFIPVQQLALVSKIHLNMKSLGAIFCLIILQESIHGRLFNGVSYRKLQAPKLSKCLLAFKSYFHIKLHVHAYLPFSKAGKHKTFLLLCACSWMLYEINFISIKRVITAKSLHKNISNIICRIQYTVATETTSLPSIN